MKKIIFYNLLILFLGLIIIELIFGNWVFGPKFSSLIIKETLLRFGGPLIMKVITQRCIKKMNLGFVVTTKIYLM